MVGAAEVLRSLGVRLLVALGFAGVGAIGLKKFDYLVVTPAILEEIAQDAQKQFRRISVLHGLNIIGDDIHQELWLFSLREMSEYTDPLEFRSSFLSLGLVRVLGLCLAGGLRFCLGGLLGLCPLPSPELGRLRLLNSFLPVFRTPRGFS